MDSLEPERSIEYMKIEILEDLIACPDGITDVEYKKGDKVEVSKEFADILITNKTGKLADTKETKVTKAEETKKK